MKLFSPILKNNIINSFKKNLNKSHFSIYTFNEKKNFFPKREKFYLSIKNDYSTNSIDSESNLKIAKDYLDKKDRENAKKHLYEASKLNNFKASHLLHLIYQDEGLAEESEKMLRLASDQGNPNSSYELAIKIMNGYIKIENEEIRFKQMEDYFWRALEEKDKKPQPFHVISAHFLAFLYLKRNAKENTENILNLFDYSSSHHFENHKAELYYFLSNYQLGLFYLDSKMVKRDVKKVKFRKSVKMKYILKNFNKKKKHGKKKGNKIF